MDHLVLWLSVFLACTVEMVEALTIILAIGTAREWRSTIQGGVSALVVLSLIVLIFGSSIQRLPRKALWLVVGSLLLLFGVQWLRNAILRYSGIKPIHDESAVFQKVRQAAKHKRRRFETVDWYAFVVAFKGVFLEGLEVVFIVLALTAYQGGLRIGVIAAAAAFLMVCLLGVLVHRPLARVPENTLKFVVGLILTTFGTFYCGKGIGIIWPGGQLAFGRLLVVYVLAVSAVLLVFKRRSERRAGAVDG